MHPIPPRLRERLAGLPRMKRCAVAGIFDECDGRIEWHHVWTYAGRQIQDEWAIVGGCHKHHEAVKQDFRVQREFERVSLQLAGEKMLAKYPRKNWRQLQESHGLK